MGKSEQTRLSRIGKYRLLARIGQGGMGTVYQARQESLDKIVALKVLAPALARQPDFVERFIREAQSSGQLSHPNIVLGFDAGEADGYYYFAMEFVDGEDLKTVLDRDGKLPERRALEITAAMAAALEHAHGHNIVHRDIKPGNILVTRAGVPKLADLGLAKEIRSDHSITQAGIPVGTPFYISPEQIRGQQNVDGRADLYALGASLYHMVAGAVPYEGPTAAIVMTRHLNDPIPDPKQHTPDLSDGTVAIIRHAMAKVPEERYQTAKELREDIQAVLAGKAPRHAKKGQAALAAAAQRMAERRAKEAAKRRTLILAGSVAGGVAVIAIVLALVLRGGGDTKTQGVTLPQPRPTTSTTSTSSTPLPRPISKQPPSTATPAIAKPSADTVYRELLDYAGSADDRDDLEKRFRDFILAQAGSPAAAKAKEYLAELKGGWKAEDDLKTAVREGVQQKKFTAAFAALEKPPFKKRSKKQDELVESLAQEAKRAASEHVAAETTKADELVQRGEFPAARDIYKALTQLGVPEAAEASQAALKKLDGLEAERRQRLAQRTMAELIAKSGPLILAGELDKARALFDPQQAKGNEAFAKLLKGGQADLDLLGELFAAAEQKLTDLAAQNGTALIKGIGRTIAKVEDHVVHWTVGGRTDKCPIQVLSCYELEKLGCVKDPLQLALLELYRNGNLKKAKAEFEKLVKEPADPVVARCLQEIEWVEALAREGEAGDLLAKAQKQAVEKSWKEAADALAQLTEKYAETGFVEKNRPAIQDLSKRIGEAIASARREAETIRPFIDVTEKCGDLGKALKSLKPVGGWILDIDHNKDAMPDIALDIRHGTGSQLVPLFLNETVGAGPRARPAPEEGQAQGPAPTFREVTKEAGLETGDEPLCWVDLDGDGRLDVVYRGLRQPGEGAQAKDHAKLGFYVNRYESRGKGDPIFRHHPELAIAADPAIVRALGGFGFGNIAVLDANGDGRSDILAQFVAGDKRTLSLFLAVRGKPLAFIDASLPAGFLIRDSYAIPEPLQVKAWPMYVVLDIDGDGKADFILNAEAGLLFRNAGNGRFVYDAKSPVKYQTYASAESGNSPVIIPAVADYDNDGKIDIFVPQRGRSLLLKNEGGGRFVDALPTTGPMATDEGDALWATWGDVNNDGLLDLFVCYAGQRNRLYIQKANHAFVDKAEEYGVTGEKGEKTNFAAFADLDRDGDLDLVILRDSGRSQVLVNPLVKADNHYSLSVVVRTPLGAIGAKVYLIRPPSEIVGLQQIGRCEGYNRQTAQEAFFGVPVPGEYLVRVVLSNGQVIQRPITVNPARRNILILDK